MQTLKWTAIALLSSSLVGCQPEAASSEVELTAPPGKHEDNCDSVKKKLNKDYRVKGPNIRARYGGCQFPDAKSADIDSRHQCKPLLDAGVTIKVHGHREVENWMVFDPNFLGWPEPPRPPQPPRPPRPELPKQRVKLHSTFVSFCVVEKAGVAPALSDAERGVLQARYEAQLARAVQDMESKAPR